MSVTADLRERRRTRDTVARRWMERLEDPATLGRALVLVTGVLTVCGAVALDVDRHSWLRLAEVSAVMLLAIALSFLVHWSALPRAATLVFPATVFLAFAALSVHHQAVFAPLSPFFTLCYGYSGLTQRPRTSLLLTPLSGVALVLVYGGLTSPVAVRLVVTTSVWVILAEVLARFAVQQRRLTQALQRAAYLDALTGVPNRRDLDNQLALTAPGTAVIVCDLDRFKQLNDTHGHSVGDQVLADFGCTVRAVLRRGDYCARFGGEEFVLLLPATSIEATEQILNRLRTRWSVLRPTVTFSAGAAQHRGDREPTATLAAADHALYAAKAAGRNTTCHEDRHATSAVTTVGATASVTVGGAPRDPELSELR